ncbi:MAG: hypothetical protein COY68_03685 [Candidatus Levybacteria bacterium CG_4_10_14_0_8_um_filter_35_23]|nr:MAG: hypothetical protein COY68_03685 [Candidatus Levybacteria bacterium CG_4_10_14_0_8_um_filter_35_23]
MAMAQTKLKVNKVIKFIKGKKIQKLIFVILFLLILIRPVQVVIENRISLLSPGYEKQYVQYEKMYYSSQFVQKKNPLIIPDEAFRSFAGGAFLRGLNPILITHDHPPLGNYMIAASIYFFDNPRTLMIPILAMIILGIYLLSNSAIKNSCIALIPLGIFISESLFTNKLVYAPLVEPLQLPFIIFAFYFFIRAVKEKKYMRWLILTSISLGIVIGTRFFVTGGVMLFCMVLYLIYERRGIDKKLIYFILTLPLALVILILSYTKTMMDGYSVIQIFGIQKYILTYHKSKFILPFSFWDLLLFNRWHTWWGDWRISSDPQWTILWPISVILTGVYTLFGLIRKITLNETEKIMILWLGVYTLTLSTGFSSTNYFLPLMPFFYILATSFLYKIYLSFQKQKNSSL